MIVRFVLLIVVFTLTPRLDAAAGEKRCPAPAPRPNIVFPATAPESRSLDPYSSTQAYAQYWDAPLGVGFLEVTASAGAHYYDWPFVLEMPLWERPDPNRTIGWLLNGRIVTDSRVEALTGAGMVETQYEHTSFIVWDNRGGWLKLKLKQDKYVWTHACHLATSDIRLDFVPWATFLERHADWLHFRRPVPHILRETPGIEGKRVTTIGLNHKLVLLEIREDWMKVDVEQPDLTCAGPDAETTKTIRHRGWVKWRDDNGPWVFIYTRGC